MVAYSFQQRFVAPIRAGLGLANANGFGIDVNQTGIIRPKRQTIRAIGKRRHARPGETLQLYRGMRTRQCFKIGEAKCTAVTPVEIRFDDIVFWVIRPASSSRMCRIIGDQLEQFAQADGFADSADMAQFWREQHGDVGCTFKGVVIEWEPLT